jgi:hypothetical protein
MWGSTRSGPKARLAILLGLLVTVGLAGWFTDGLHPQGSSSRAAPRINVAKHPTVGVDRTSSSHRSPEPLRHYAIRRVAPADGPIETDEMPSRVPADGVAVWSHVVPYFPHDGIIPEPLPAISQMLAEVPKGYPTISQIESEEEPSAIFEPMQSPSRGVVSPSVISRDAEKIDQSSALRQSAPLLVRYVLPPDAGQWLASNPPYVPGNQPLAVYVVVASSSTPIETPSGCQAAEKSCPFTFATHHLMIFDAHTGIFFAGFFTP